jgi:hypothetical protein
MATINPTIYKLETPKSESDSTYDDFEYMLQWQGDNGEPLRYLFTDWENSENVNVNGLNRKDLDLFKSIPENANRSILLTAEDLTKNDLEIYKSILRATEIYRVFKDGTTERVGKASDSNEFRQTNGRYDFNFVIDLYKKPLKS